MGAALVLPILVPRVVPLVAPLILAAAGALIEVLKKPPELPVFLPSRQNGHLILPVAVPKPQKKEVEEEERKKDEERKKNMMRMVDAARKEMGINCVNHYNFAVCGQSGTGKSSFINAIRHIKDNHPDAAEVGVVETTQKVKKYSHPDLKHAFIWDLPGAGTMQHPAATYFEDKMLYAFDCIFILSSDRFLRVDMEVAKSALEHQKSIAFVRTKADVAIKNLCLGTGLTAKKASELFRSKVVANFKENLENVGLSNQAHKISLFIIANTYFKRPKVYTFYDEENETLDKSLEKMDEDKIYEFMEASVRTRFRPHPCR